VLVDSEGVWDEARRQLVRERGGTWTDGATREMMGMSSVEWSRYVRDELGVNERPEQISDEVVERLERLYRQRLPLIDGAVEAVRRLAERWPLGLATSSNREVIDLVLDLSGLDMCFEVTVSSEEVGRGKPAPDVYLEVARRMSVAPGACTAIEDSHNGILSALAAGMHVIAIPNRKYPPREAVLARAEVVLDSLAALDADVVERAGASG
jgi:HAD superfamily hydrolase (TIGR01509 family)